MSSEDIDFAMSVNHCEVQEAVGQVIDDEVVHVPALVDEVDVIDHVEVQSEGLSIQCEICGDDVKEPLSDIMVEFQELVGSEKYATLVSKVKEIENDERLYDLKTLIKANEEGIIFNYKCPKCRACQDCKNSNETERISLREEIEDQEIRNSVTIDFDAKKITAKLPLRGDESKFLSDSRVIAEKVLNGQCIKVKNDEE